MAYDIEKIDDILRFYDKDGNEIKVTEIPKVVDNKLYDIAGNEISLEHSSISGELEIEDSDGNKGEYSSNQIKLVASDYYIIMDMDDSDALMSYTLYDNDDNTLNNFKITDSEMSTNKSLIIQKGSDNYTHIVNNLVRMYNTNGDYSQVNQIDDSQVLEIALKDKDSNVLSTLYLKNDLIEFKNDIEANNSVKWNSSNDNLYGVLRGNEINLHNKNYYFEINKYDGDDDKGTEFVLKDNDDNVMNRFIVDDVKTLFDKDVNTAGDIHINPEGDNHTTLTTNQIKLFNSDYYFSIDKADDTSDVYMELRDDSDNVISSIVMGTGSTDISNDLNCKSDFYVNKGEDNYALIKDNEVRLYNENDGYFYINQLNSSNISELALKDSDSNLLNQILIKDGVTEFKEDVVIQSDKLVVNDGSDYYTEINTNDVTFNAGDDGGKAVFTKTNASTDCRLENMDKDENILSYIKFQGNYTEVGSSSNALHISTTSWRFDKHHGSDFKIEADADLSGGWYTIATFGDHEGRGLAEFMIIDTKSSHHQTIRFTATHMYGIDSSNYINVLSQSYYAKQVITHIRIKEAGTYDGCVVQVYISDDGDSDNQLTIFYNGANPYEDGWKLKNFIPDDTDPGDVDNYDDMTEKTQVNMKGLRGSFSSRDHTFTGGDVGIRWQRGVDGNSSIRMHNDDEDLIISEPEDSDKEWFKLKDDDDLYIFGKKVFRDIDHNFDDNGYQKFGGSGLIIQWGKYTSTSDDDETFDFPISFPNACYSVQISPITSNGGDSIGVGFPVTSNDTDGFTINRDNDIDVDSDFYMFAIGY